MAIEHDIEWDEAKIARLWDYHASVGAEYFADKHGGRILKASGLPLREPLRVLDYGCGPGFLWRHLQELGSRWRYTGIDVSADSIAELKARAGDAANFDGVYQLGSLPVAVPAEGFDAALMIEVVEHLDDARLDATLREVARLLKPGGKLLITTPNDEDLAASKKFCPECGAKFHEWQHVRSWKADSLARCLFAYGFREVRSQATNITIADWVSRLKFRFGRRLRNYPSPHLIALFEKA